MSVFSKVLHFIAPFYDLLILAFAIVTLINAAKLWKKRDNINNKISDWEDKSDNFFNVDRNKEIMKSYEDLNRFYTRFITRISIFPLLGMLGTVVGLLGLDMSGAEAISNAKDSFFTALTSTFWGIICAVIFKGFNAKYFYDVEDLIQRHLSLITTLRKNGIERSRGEKNEDA